MKVHSRKCLLLLGVLLVATAVSLFAPNYVLAKQGDGGQVSHSCQLKDYYRGKLPNKLQTCMSVGASFAYFQYTKNATEALSIGSNMGPVTPATDKYIKPIKGCTQYGGFLHLGVVDGKKGTWKKGNVSVSYSGNISLGNFNINSVEVWDEDMNGLKVGTQDISVNNTLVAQLKGFVMKNEARKRYREWLEISGEKDLWANGTLAWFCWSPNMGQATYEAKTESSGSNGDVTSKNGNYSITFKHSMRRTDKTSFNPSNGSSWSTNISGGGKQKNGKYTSTSTSFSSVASDTITGTLAPGEEKTFCQSITYDKTVTQKGSQSRATSSRKCVTVRRQNAKCFGREYGVNAGKNYGSISVSKNGSWIQAQPSTPEGFNTNKRTALAEIWTRPNDRVTFKTEMCEGAEVANQYRNFNKNISYSLNASEIKYLDGLSPRSWNNNSIKGKANVGKGIFAGSYTNQTRTPKNNGSYNVTTNHVGKSFSQVLTWTDLWISGGAIDNNHNRGGATWNDTATAIVYTPYNFTTSVSLEDNRSSRDYYVLTGNRVGGINIKYQTRARKNPKVVNSAYATVSKPIKRQAFSFIVGSNARADSVELRNEYVADASGNLKLSYNCSAYIKSPAGTCETALSATGGKASDKLPSGTSTTTNDNISVLVPETAEIGAKICVVGAIWPADSHDLPNQELNINSDQAPALRDGGAYWHLSKPTCFAIAKKPTLQVRNTGAYARKQVNTAITNRNNKLFGSWADYELVAGGAVNGMASGAMLWGASNSPSIERACYFSPLTLTNDRCKTDRKVGSIPATSHSSGFVSKIYQNIKARYASDTSKVTSGNLREYGYCSYNPSSKKYSPVGGRTDFRCLENGTNYSYFNKNTETQASGTSILQSRPEYLSNNTWVVRVDGTLTINRNYVYWDGAYASPGDIPQLIFIAKKIDIAPNVTRLDAWLIAEDTINTCAGVDLGVANCDSQLTVTGPVIARKIVFNRTFGGNGNVVGMSTGAEIFRLSPATYLWSFAQTSRSTQASTTYQRELPTRY